MSLCDSTLIRIYTSQTIADTSRTLSSGTSVELTRVWCNRNNNNNNNCQALWKDHLSLSLIIFCVLKYTSICRKSKNSGVGSLSFSRGSWWPRNWTRVSCIAGRFFTSWTSWATREALILEQHFFFPLIFFLTYLLLFI